MNKRTVHAHDVKFQLIYWLPLKTFYCIFRAQCPKVNFVPRFFSRFNNLVSTYTSPARDTSNAINIACMQVLITSLITAQRCISGARVCADMKHARGRPLREVEKRKKIFLFVGLCIVTFLIVILTVVLVSVLKSDSDDDEKEIKISKYIIYFFRFAVNV